MTQASRPVYLDCAATTPIDPRVRDVVMHYMEIEYGNAGSRTHIYGQEAAKGVKEAREQVGSVVGASREGVVFTSGATEANNLAILGLADYGRKAGKRHVLSTQIEHMAVLKPLECLANNGFEIELIPADESGRIDADELVRRVRSDTLLISVMQVNNETGVVQPISEICSLLAGQEPVLHVDAAQGFGKELRSLQAARVDLISVSAHKCYGPKGVGALIMKNPSRFRNKLTAIHFGGDQERGLRPGTAPVPLIAGFGFAAKLLADENESWNQKCLEFRKAMLDGMSALPITIIGSQENCLQSTIALQIGQIDAEAVMLSLKEEVAISNGSACTSEKYVPSHVMSAMGVKNPEAVTRWSWCHYTSPPDWKRISKTLKEML